MQKLRILLFLLGLFQLCAISYANVIILNDSAESYNAIHNADYIQISKDKVFCEEELANVEWEKYPNKALLFSYKCRAVVLRIITNNRSKNSDFIITCQQPNTDHFEIINGHFETIKTSGDVHSWQKREFNDIFPSFSLNLRQGFQDTTYCKIIIAEDGIAPFQLRTRDSYYSHFAKRELVFGIFIGLMGVIVIYNLFLFFIINDKLYLHYALYVLAILFAQMSLYDGINHVYTDYVPLAKIDGIFFVAVLGPFGYGFVLNYFKFVDTHWIKKVMKIIIVIFVLIAIAVVLKSEWISELQIFLNLTYLVSYVFAFAIAGLGLRYQKELSIIFICGWTILLLGGTFFALTNMGITEYNRFTYFMMPVGAAIETIILSFAVGLRMRILKKQNEIADLKIAKQEEESKQLKMENTESELYSLRSQLNPHFIFNSLNSIQKLILKEDTENASKYLVNFAKLMRQSLLFSEVKTVTIAEEIKFLSKYLEIEKLRFKDRFDFSFTLSENLVPEDLKIPSLIIQIFVENSVKHAFADKTKIGKIDIRFLLDKTEENIRIEIEDNGTGFQNKLTSDKHKSKGIAIIKQRIELLNKELDDKITLDIINKKSLDTSKTGVLVKLNIPV